MKEIVAAVIQNIVRVARGQGALQLREHGHSSSFFALRNVIPCATWVDLEQQESPHQLLSLDSSQVMLHTETEEYAPITADAGQLPHPDLHSRASVMAITIQFVRQHWLAMTLISALLLAPCFWHRYIEAGDLDSHMYNAWLAQLIERGQAPGLWIANQWSNMLFDTTVSNLGNIFGLPAAEKIAVSLAVLLFFWGEFSLIAACTRRAPWFLAPVLAMLAYGWTFQVGFLNFYISLALSFFSLAIFWRGRGAERLLALAFAPFIWMAHPLGLAWLIGAAGYIVIAEHLSGRAQILLVSASAILIALVSWYLMRYLPGPSASLPGLAANGSNQLLLFEPRYLLPTRLLLAFSIACLLTDVLWRRDQPPTWSAYALPFQLYIVAILGVSMLPDAVGTSSSPAPLTLLTPRLSSICAIFGCCLLGATRPLKWHLIPDFQFELSLRTFGCSAASVFMRV